MYCIKCGVELADSEKKCPLCGTVVFNPELSRPDGEPQYPRMPAAQPEKVNHSGIMFVVTMLFLQSDLLMKQRSFCGVKSMQTAVSGSDISMECEPERSVPLLCAGRM